MQILNLKINNFRGIKEFQQSFDDSKLICFVGRGDSCKTTILQAIYFVLYPQRWLNVEDSDFYNLNIEETIKIEVTIGKFKPDLFKEICRDDNYGGFLHKWDSKTKTSKEIWDEENEDNQEECCLKVLFSVDKSLEPKWDVLSSNSADTRPIHASDRSKFNASLIEDYQDRHFTLSKGSPLLNLYKNISSSFKDEGALQQVVRDIQKNIDDKKEQIFDGDFIKFCSTLKNGLEKYNVNIDGEISPSLIANSFHNNNTNFILQDKVGPLYSKGKGTKRLTSIAIQSQLANNITLVDEIEQGLEPDRVKSLINTLKEDIIEADTNIGQIFITTHSRDVIVECDSSDIFIIRNIDGVISCTNPKANQQGALRKNPEVIFSKKIIICEGATEVGIVRSLEKYTYTKFGHKLSYLGVGVADGSGSKQFEYTQNYLDLGYKVCLFCDSDRKEDQNVKKELISKGATICNWSDGLCIETAIIKNLPWDEVIKVVELAKNYTDNESIYDSINNDYSKKPLSIEINDWTDEEELRNNIADKMHKNAWFKNISKGEDLGDLIFKIFDSLDEKNEIKTCLNNIIEWYKK